MSDTQKIDVLAVLDKEIADVVHFVGTQPAEELQQVRAAVAELIEAAEEMRVAHSGPRDEGRSYRAVQRIAAALACVGR